MLDKAERRRILKKSQQQEKKAAKRVGGRVNPGSGSGWARPNDVRGEDGRHLIEYKRTDATKSITLKSSDLRLVEQHGLLESRIPVLGFELGGRNYVVLTEEDWLTELEDLRNDNQETDQSAMGTGA